MCYVTHGGVVVVGNMRVEKKSVTEGGWDEEVFKNGQISLT